MKKKPIRIYTQLSNGHIIISSNDKVLQFMTISGSTLKEEFAMKTPYQCQITRILSISHDRYVILPKDEPNISVWSSLFPYSLVPLGLMYHKKCRIMFQLKNKEILLTNSPNIFKLFDLTNYQVIKIIQDLNPYLYLDCVQLDDENILSTHYQINIKTNKVQQITCIEIPLVNFMSLRGNKILCVTKNIHLLGSFYFYIISSSNTNNKVKIFDSYQSNDITCLKRINNYTFMFISNKSIKIWNY